MVTGAPPMSNLDKLLILIAVKLELTPTQYQDAMQKYQSVSDWLSVPESPLARFSPDIYPQGSLRLLTTVKPRAHEEYDLDIVCQLLIDWQTTQPLVVFNMIHGRLAEHHYYKTILEAKKRCSRLDFAGLFHMDVLGAVPDQTVGGTAVRVPDRELQLWMASNPKGFANWFESRMGVTVAEKAAEPLPLPIEAPNKTALQRAVQLVKRQRDQAFGDSGLAPASIVLTTLAGEANLGQTSAADAVSAYIGYVDRKIDAAGARPFKVYNPSNTQELLSERWESEAGAYDAFKQEFGDFKAKWQQLLRAQTLEQMESLLKDLFGEDVTTRAFTEFGRVMAESRNDGTLGVQNTGSRLSVASAATPSVRPITRNTNYGPGQ